jgi:acetylornithine/LysW-gamma-L-lysine aminotransferase
VNEKDFIDIENRLMANVFSKRPVVLVKGRGAVIYDIKGKQYIDCTGSYGVALIGHSHPEIVKAIHQQAQRLISCHGCFYSDARAEFLEKLVNIMPSGLNKVFLSNSGAEAVECAIKLARKYTGKPEIIAFMGGFHGKTMGALSITWDKKYREPFMPLVPGIVHVPPDNLEKVKDAINEKTAAIIVEPIRGEGGIRVPPDGFLQGLREICREKNVLLIFDEVQTGLGRTGKMFACEHWKTVPDIMCLAKPLAGGLPIGVTVAKENIMSSFKVGEHSSTFGGNPLVCAAASATIDVIVREKLPERAATNGEYFKKKLAGLQEKHRIIKEVRGLGLMLGMELRVDILNALLRMLDRGVLLLEAGRNVLRFLPPLVIEREQIDQVVSMLDATVEEEENARNTNSLPR